MSGAPMPIERPPRGRVQPPSTTTRPDLSPEAQHDVWKAAMRRVRDDATSAYAAGRPFLVVHLDHGAAGGYSVPGVTSGVDVAGALGVIEAAGWALDRMSAVHTTSLPGAGSVVGVYVFRRASAVPPPPA